MSTLEKRQFIFGYGSLICPKSRAITAPTLAARSAYPIIVRNLKRSWSARVIVLDNDDTDDEATTPQQHDQNNLITGQPRIRGHTAMGVRKIHTFSSAESSICSWCSGVLIEVNDLELEQFDKREQGYERVAIDLVDIWNLHEHEEGSAHITDDPVKVQQHIVLDEADRIRNYQNEHSQLTSPISVWVYIQQLSIPANPQFPIVQSYVDVILRGCLSISPVFARRFLETTDLWWHDNMHECRRQEYESERRNTYHSHYVWIEDRHDPYYIRADPIWSLTMASSLDAFLQEHHPHAFQRRIQLPSISRILNAFEKSNEEEFD